MLIIPWLTLFLVKKNDIKRFMPVAFFSIIISVIVTEAGITTGLWNIWETTFPLSQIPTYTFGIIPVVVIWIFKFTYGQFWLYFVLDCVLNLVFVYLILPLLAGRGILDFTPAPIHIITSVAHDVLLYGYQIWQEGIFARSEQTSLSLNLHPAATKPLPQTEDRREPD